MTIGSAPTPDFEALVKDALERLYDPVSLRAHPLTRVLLPADLPLGVGKAQALRQVLLDAMEQLNPGASVSAESRHRRVYQILEMRYVEALPFRDVMAELALSQPQYHRDQRRALEALAMLLWERRARPAGDEPTEEATAADDRRYSDLEAAASAGSGLVDLNDVVHGVVDILSGLAAGRQVALHEELAPTGVLIRGSRTILRQLVINAASYVLQGAQGGQLVFTCQERDGRVELHLAYQGSVSGVTPRASDEQERLAVGRQILQSLGGSWRVEPKQGGLAISVSLPSYRPSLLVIDDNPDMVHLITRFIADQGYTVVSAATVREGIALAQTVRPALVLLDIMIPEQDGWDALQGLKHHPSTQDIPVLVCTVLAESELALSLGAADFLRKPLTRPALLQALARWAPRPPRPVAASRGSAGPSESVPPPETPGC